MVSHPEGNNVPLFTTTTGTPASMSDCANSRGSNSAVACVIMGPIPVAVGITDWSRRCRAPVIQGPPHPLGAGPVEFLMCRAAAGAAGPSARRSAPEPSWPPDWRPRALPRSLPQEPLSEPAPVVVGEVGRFGQHFDVAHGAPELVSANGGQWCVRVVGGGHVTSPLAPDPY